MITIFDLALGSSRQVSHSLIARGLKLSFTLLPSRPTVLEFVVNVVSAFLIA